VFYVRGKNKDWACKQTELVYMNTDSQEISDSPIFFSTVYFYTDYPTFAAAGRTRPAPAELPQGRKVARVSGRSGAMY